MNYVIDKEVLNAVHDERVFQNRKWGTIAQHPHEVGGYITIMRKLLCDAEQAWSTERGDVGALGQAEAELRAGLGRIYAVAEAYPELKSNHNFMQLQQRISALENAIADRREFYNDAVNINNTHIELFPASLLAKWFRFGPKSMLEFSADETADVDMPRLFG